MRSVRFRNFFDLPYRPFSRPFARATASGKAFAARWGYESFETDWRKLVDSKEIDLIDIASPNDTHARNCHRRGAAGKMVMCEKPLGRTPAEVGGMVKAVENAGVANMVWYNYRRIPAVTLAKNLVDEGHLGRIFHYRTVFCRTGRSPADLPQGGEGLWRLDAERCRQWRYRRSSRAQHRYCMWLNGQIDEVTAMTETFIKSANTI